MVNEVKAKIKEGFPSLVEGVPFYDQLSSIELVELVTFIEENFSVQIQALEFSRDLFKDAETIAALIERKRNH